MAKRVLCVVPELDAHDRLVVELLARLEERGVETVLADVEEAERVGLHDYDALILAGEGEAATRLWGRRPIEQLVWGAVQERKPVGALGEAVGAVAQTELLAYQVAACPPGGRAAALLARHHVTPSDAGVCEAVGGIITARGTGDVEEFVHLFSERLGLRARKEAGAVEAAAAPPSAPTA